MESKDPKKKPYSFPTLTRLTAEQAKKLVADRKLCNEEDAADFFKLAPTPLVRCDDVAAIKNGNVQHNTEIRARTAGSKTTKELSSCVELG
jgi:hypothetical protein